jgi:release factor glutamine methyltransferase
MKEIVKQVSEDFSISRDEAELIVATLLDQPRFEMYLNNKVDADTLKLLNMKLSQLKGGMPIEYVTKKVQFMNFSLHIYPGVFIPRLETEYFIELTTKLANFHPKRVLEIGTGTGAISIALATLFPEANFIATDISQPALKCALENVEKYNLKKQITLVGCDMFKAISKQFDLIISNPPYIPLSRLQSLPKSVKEFEPLSAIDGGKQGVQFITRFIQKGKLYLNPQGGMALEIDEDGIKILENFLKNNVSYDFFFKKDLFGRFRYLFIGNFKNEESKNSNQ